MVRRGRGSELLGFPPEARVLLVNADDLGLSPSVTRAIVESIDHGIVRSTSLLTVCPGTGDALEVLRRRRDVPFGVHLALVRDGRADRWRPLTALSSLVDHDGLLPLHRTVGGLLLDASIREIGVEFRAQLTRVLDAGLSPTHLDFHGLADGGRDDVLSTAIDLAREHGLAVRVWGGPGRSRARADGLPVVDHPFLDSFTLDVEAKAQRYAALLRALPAGLTEWAVHPGPGGDTHDARVRGGDLAFLTSARAADIVTEEGITLIDYRPVQRVWSAA